MNDHSPELFEFDEFCLDLRARTLRCRGKKVPLRPKSFDVLAYLVRNAGRPLSKDEIVEKVWSSVAVTDDSLTRCISDARTALNDQDRHIIQTLPGTGYQLSSDIRRPVGTGAGNRIFGLFHANKLVLLSALFGLLILLALLSLAPFEREKEFSPIRASIAVLPFGFEEGDSKLALLANGLTNDLNTALGQVPEMLVISSNSTGKYKNQAIDIVEVARELGVDHVLTGRVQVSGDRVRVTAQLADGHHRTVVWSHRYDRNLADFLGLQDDIVKNILIGLQVKLTHGDTARILGQKSNNLDAWLLGVQGNTEGFKFLRENNMNARRLFEAAAKLDPTWSIPISGMAWTYREALRRGWSEDPEADRRRWFELSQKCMELDDQASDCYIQLGNYYIENGRIDDGIALREKALQLAPNDLSALSGLGWQLVLIGQVDRGLELLRRAKLVSPIQPPWLLATEAFALHKAKQYDLAIERFQQALVNIDFPILYARLAAVYVEVGDLENARIQADKYLKERPNGNIAQLTSIFRIQDPAETERYADLLRKAGIPD